MSDNKTFNIILPLFIVFALIGLYWLSRLGLDAGDAYLNLFYIGIAFILITVVLKYIAKLDFDYEIPINRSNERAVLALFLGIVTLFVLYGVSNLTGLNIYSPFVTAPLAQFGTGFGEQTFAALQAATSPFWTFFIIVISAAVIEELVLGFAFVKMGTVVMGYSMRKLMGLDFGDKGNEIWDFIGAMLFSIIIFAVLHFFNNTYIDPATGKMIWELFIWAMGFRLVLNILIYKFANFGIEYSIGVHAVNNAMYLGGATVVAALFTWPGGIILSVIGLLILIFGVINIRKLWREGELMTKDLMTFD